MPFCNNCGAEVKTEQKFCWSCGNNLPEATVVSESEGEDRKSVVDREELEKKVENGMEAARKGLGAAWRIAQKGVKKGVEVTSTGLETARDAIEERLSNEENEKPEKIPSYLTCKNCSELVAETSKFCKNCGKPLEPDTPKDQLKPQETETDNFWKSNSFDEVKQILAYIVDSNSQALLNLTNEVLPFMKSHLVKSDDSVRLTEEGGPATVYGLLFYLNFLSIISRNTLHNFGIIPDHVSIPDEHLERIGDKFQEFADSYAETKAASEALFNAASPFSDYANDLSELLYKEEVNNVNTTRNFEKSFSKFKENLEKINLDDYRKYDYHRYLEANEQGDLITSSLSAETSYGKFLYIYSYILHNNFSTDLERYASPFFSADNVDTQYYNTITLVEECKKNSGFLKSPPQHLKDETLNALNTLSQMVMILASSYHIARSSFYDTERIQERIEDVRRHIKRKEYNKMLRIVYDLIYQANMVQPVLRLISPY
jgi:hypothetical protein